MNPAAFSQPPASINPALLASSQGQYGHPAQNGQNMQYGANMAGRAPMNPQLYQQYPHLQQQNAPIAPSQGVNPQQLMNGQGAGVGGGGGDPMMLMQLQQRHLQQQKTHANMNGVGMNMGNMGMGGMGNMGNMGNMGMNGVNPASLAANGNANAQQQYMAMMSGNMAGMSPQQLQAMQAAKMQQRVQHLQAQQQQQQHQQNQQQQYNAGPQQQSQYQPQQHMPQPQTPQQQQHYQPQQTSANPYFDPNIGRPASAARSMSGGPMNVPNPQMTPKMGAMPPPAGIPRPPTTRPSTAMSSHSTSNGVPQGMMRPPSRPTTAASQHPPPQPLTPQNTGGSQGSQMGGMNMGMNSGGMGMNMAMGMPNMPMNMPMRPPATPRQQSGGPMPMNGHANMGGMNLGMNMGMSAQVPQTPKMGAPAPMGMNMGVGGMPGLDMANLGMPAPTPDTMKMGRMGDAQPLSRSMSIGAGGMPPPTPTSAGAAPAIFPPTIGSGGLTPQQQAQLANAVGRPRTISASGSVPPASAVPSGIIPQLPPLPAHVKLNPAITRVSVVPLVTSEDDIPMLEEDEIENVKNWIELDNKYAPIYAKMNDRMAEERRTAVQANKPWWETTQEEAARRRRPPEKFQITFAKDREREVRRKSKHPRREGLKLPRKLEDADAERPEQLIPIRLDFDVEQNRMRDTFVWNLNDPVVTPEIFAQSIVDDYQLPPNFHSTITKMIQEQLSDYKAHTSSSALDEGEVAIPVGKGRLDEDGSKWWEAWRKCARTPSGYARSGRKDGGRRAKRRKITVKEEDGDADGEIEIEEPVSVEHIRNTARYMPEEVRIAIKLDIIVGSMELNDQFEWDLDNEDASPEQFADVYARDLGLPGEFKTAIAHSIREQVQSFQKSIFLVGNPTPGQLQDEELKGALLPTLGTGTRAMEQVPAFTPRLDYISDGEIERSEREREKELNRRKKRNTRARRGVALPDREPLRTYRTPAIGFPEVDPANLTKDTVVTLPTNTRRAAAAAAQLTIANMVANENREGDPLSPQVLPLMATPSQTAVPQKKEPKVKGLFKPPSYPSAVLRPRARVPAPTPSTSAEPTVLMTPLEELPETVIHTMQIEYRPPPPVVAPISTKRARELEREAKDKEYADNQHANYIDGVWHCSNCGIPESIAVGRRKGPLGDKSQCGVCGKFWHRHRRPRPVEWNPSAEYHATAIRDAEMAKAASKRGRGRPPASSAAATPVAADLTAEPETPLTETAPLREADGDRPSSPASSDSSEDEAPLAQRVKANGVTRDQSSGPQDASRQGGSPTRPNAHSRAPPDWLTNAMREFLDRYPDERIEAAMRKPKTGETEDPDSLWRIRCLDCPQKLYTPGPGETLTGYEVHLTNRGHRNNVKARLERERGGSD